MNAPLDALLLRLVEHWDHEEPGWIPVDRIEDLTAREVPYTTEAELTELRRLCRQMASRHPFALAALEIRVSYVVGTGHTYKVRPLQPRDGELARQVEQELETFRRQNRWHHRQQEIQWRLDRDGEVFLRFFEGPQGLLVRFVEPEDVTQPPGRQAPWGLQTHPEDAEQVLGYWVRRGTQYELVEADQIQHRKANVSLASPRGLPTLYGALESLARVRRLLRNMGTVAEIQAAIALIRRHKTTTSVQQVPWAVADQKHTGSDGKTRTYQEFPPGAILDMPPNVEVELPAAGVNVAAFVEAIQAELRAVAARLGMPEYMLSSDASNANYSSTLVAEGPAVKMFERLQAAMIWYDLEVLQRHLELVARLGRLPRDVLQRVQIDAEAPVVQSRDRLKEVQADQILLAQGVISPQTVAAKYGYDYSRERDLMDAS